jgi:hypothetical protein
VPIWQVILLGLDRGLRAAVSPIGRMWTSTDPLDTYGLCHMASVAGDALLAVALADSVFFSLPVGEAKLRVAAYLALTMLPLALAGPLLVPLLDRAGPRRMISFAAAAGRFAVALYAAPRFSTLLLFPSALILLVLSKVHAITKNGLTMAYAPHEEGLMRANARLGRIAALSAVVVAPIGIAFLKIWGAAGPIYLAAVFYAISALVVLRLPHPRTKKVETVEVAARGRIPSLAAPAVGAVGMRAASGFLLFLLAFSLREGGAPPYWFVVLGAAGVAGTFLADVIAPRLPASTREEAVVIACVTAGCIGAILAFELFGLPLLMIFGLVAGATTEFGRLAFQSLMQRSAPEGALGRVFVRYEVLFQLSWVAGAFLPALLPIDFRTGILILAAFYLVLAALYVFRFRRHRGLPVWPKEWPAGKGPA